MEEFVPTEFHTTYLQQLQEVDAAQQQRAQPTAGGRVDGGDPYGNPPYLAGRSYQEGSFANQAYLEGYNQLLASLQMSKQEAPVPQSDVPSGEG